MQPHVALMSVDIENFRSFRGRRRVGPFTPFTMLIELKGSEKSNFVDAVNFVMGEKISSLRVKKLSNLVYGATNKTPVSRRASVTATFRLERTSERCFRRSIAGELCSYSIDGRVVPRNNYIKELHDLGLNLETKNFLVSQEAVRSIAMQSPRERAVLLEQLSGSYELKNQLELCLKNASEAEKEAEQWLQKVRDMDTKSEEAKLHKDTVEQYTRLKQQLVDAYIELERHSQENIEKTQQELAKVDARHDQAKDTVTYRSTEALRSELAECKLDQESRQLLQQRATLEATPAETIEPQLSLDNLQISEYAEAIKLETAQQEADRVDLDRVSRLLLKLQNKRRSKQRDHDDAVARLCDIYEYICNLKEDRERRLQSQEGCRQVAEPDIVDSLKRALPGVFGRLHNLCRPKDARFKVATMAALRKSLLSIVVDTNRTARTCSRVIRRKRLHRQHIIALDRIQAKPPSERVKHLQARMLMETLQYEPAVRRALERVCGNLVVCETHEDAVRVAYDSEARCDALTLDGTVYAKSGIISGGMHDLADKASRWGEPQLKKKKEQPEQELRESSEDQYADASAQRKATVSHIETMKKEVAHIEAQMQRLELKKSSIELRIKKREGHIQELCLNVVASAISQCKQPEVQQINAAPADLGCSEETEESAPGVQEMEQRKRTCSVAKGRLHSLQEAIMQVDPDDEAIEPLLSTSITRSSSLNAEVEDSTRHDQEKRLQQNIQDLQLAVAKMKAQAMVMGVEAPGHQDEVSDNHSWASLKLVTVEALVHQAEEELMAEALDHTGARPIPADVMGVEAHVHQDEVSDNYSWASLKLVTVEALVHQAEEELMAEALDHTGGTYADGDPDVEAIEPLVSTSITRSRLSSLNGHDHEERLLQKIRDLQLAVANMQAPTLKAIEAMKKIDGTNNAYTEASQKVLKATKDLQKLREDLRTKFMNCFEHVAKQIGATFTAMALGRPTQVVLRLENPEEPMDGVSYSYIAPGEHLQPVSSLPEEDRLWAALALHYTIRSYLPPPFIMLDVIDPSRQEIVFGRVCSHLLDLESSQTQTVMVWVKEDLPRLEDGSGDVYVMPLEALDANLEANRN